MRQYFAPLCFAYIYHKKGICKGVGTKKENVSTPLLPYYCLYKCYLCAVSLDYTYICAFHFQISSVFRLRLLLFLVFGGCSLNMLPVNCCGSCIIFIYQLICLIDFIYLVLPSVYLVTFSNQQYLYT